MRLFEPSLPDKMEGAGHEPAHFTHGAAVVGAVAAKRRRAPGRPRIAIWATVVAIVVGFTLPASADERPSDPFGIHTTEINKDTPLVGIWESL